MAKHSTNITTENRPKASPETLKSVIVSCFDDMLLHVDSSAPSPQPLFDLIEQIRPNSSTNTTDIVDRFKVLTELLADQPCLATVLTDYVFTLLRLYTPDHFYSDTGILANDGFFTTLSQRLIWRLIPPLQSECRVDTLFNAAFNKPNDDLWLDRIPLEQWHRLSYCFSAAKPLVELMQSTQHVLLNALMILSYRVTAMGLERELMRIDPSIDEFESPFMAQNREVLAFVQSYQPFYINETQAPSQQDSKTRPVEFIPAPDENPTAVMIEQCRSVLARVRKNTKRYGVSIQLTNLMIRIEQSLSRMELLFDLLLGFQRSPYLDLSISNNNTPSNVQKKTTNIPSNSLQTSLQILADDQKNHTSIGNLISTNTELIALQVTENASKTGDHYVTDDRRGYFEMLRSAMGAGAIIAVMATLKVLLGRLILAPFIKAFLNSMNYSLGFMLIHVMHFTVATKQPAMTAAAIAATVHQSEKNNQAQANQLTELAQLTVNIMRTQIIAIIGNISVAMPIGALIAYFWQTILNKPLLSADAAQTLLQHLNPVTSLAIPHAAIAGVCLFLSGLIAGYYDNLSVYHQVGARLRQHPRLKKCMAPERLFRMSNYIENNLGALASNFWFGVMLGSMGTLGYILGLPLDIRHIAFASVNFAQSVYTLGTHLDLSVIIISFVGVLLIGLTNLLVSFSLALFVALKARRVSFNQWLSLGKVILGHFFTRPTDFFMPPAHPNFLQDDREHTEKPTT
ncbi:MAG: site-specific recombinase [Candidatus Saccharibacteria bacterium]|nr:site-specific recombinase [Moraxellaceae bacterium]